MVRKTLYTEGERNTTENEVKGLKRVSNLERDLRKKWGLKRRGGSSSRGTLEGG